MVNNNLQEQKGFTLIETLISMVLLSMIIFVGSMSFSTFSSKWQDNLGHFDSKVIEVKMQFLLQKTLQSTANYLAKESKNQEPYYFFHGNSQELLFVSNNPIFSENTQAMVRLSVVYNANNTTSSILYQEAPMTEQILLQKEFAPLFLNQTLLLTNKQNIRFNYFGWKNPNERIEAVEDNEIMPTWDNNYHGDISGIMPLAINISWDDSEPIIIPLFGDRAYMLTYSKHSNNDA